MEQGWVLQRFANQESSAVSSPGPAQQGEHHPGREGKLQGQKGWSSKCCSSSTRDSHGREGEEEVLMRKQFHWTEKAAASRACSPAHQGGMSWDVDLSRNRLRWGMEEQELIGSKPLQALCSGAGEGAAPCGSHL